jgi:hypothetical protein
MLNLKIWRFRLDLKDEAEIKSRFFGEFKDLVGKVMKSFKPEVHVIQPFKVPLDWPVTALIDVHLNKPQAVSFFAVDPQGRHYQIGEIWENASPQALADDIIRRKRSYAWRLEMAEIDPWSKGDAAYVKNRQGVVDDTFNIMSERLSEFGDIVLNTASKDKESGIRNIANWLKGPNGQPTIFFFNTCKKSIEQYQKWVYDDEGKPKKENDDFPENLYRYTLMGVDYTDPKKLFIPNQPLKGVV